MAARRVSGVLMMFTGRMGGDYRRISGGVGRCFLVIPDLRCEMALRLDSVLTCGVGIRPLKKLL
jgi:hypothetical protein